MSIIDKLCNIPILLVVTQRIEALSKYCYLHHSNHYHHFHILIYLSLPFIIFVMDNIIYKTALPLLHQIIGAKISGLRVEKLFASFICFILYLTLANTEIYIDMHGLRYILFLME